MLKWVIADLGFTRLKSVLLKLWYNALGAYYDFYRNKRKARTISLS